MDMFDYSAIIDFMKIEPGHGPGLIQSFLLFLIWLQSKGLRKEMIGFKESFTEARFAIDRRFEKIENRITILEGGKL